jgi:hypothetical protein
MLPAVQQPARAAALDAHREHPIVSDFRHLAAQHDGLAEKIAHERRCWMVVQLAGRTHLLDPTVVHDGDPIGHAERFVLVVGDEDDRDAELSLEQSHLDPHLLAELGVQVAERLVEQQHVRLVDQRPRQRHSLLLTTRQQRRRSLSIVLHADQFEHPRDLLVDGCSWNVADRQWVGHVVEHGHVRPDGVALKHHAHVASVGLNEDTRLGVDHRRTGDADPSAVDAFETGDHAQRGGLAAAGRTQQGEHLAAFDAEADPVDGAHVAEVASHVVKLEH